MGETLIRWSIRLAVACYVARVCLDLRCWGRCDCVTLRRKALVFWTVGCALYVFHVGAAFHFQHEWSHASAYQHTAMQTAAITGFDWGGGLYVNYAFTAFWLADTIAWWNCGIDFPYRSPRYFWTLHGTFAFMVLNATVVFGPLFWKWVGILVVVTLILLVRQRKATASQ